MNKADFAAMQRQLTPSPQARAALEARLESAPPKRRPGRWKYGLLAACAVLAVCAVSLAQQYLAPRHAVQSGPRDALAYEEYATQEGTLSLPKLNIWDTQPPLGIQRQQVCRRGRGQPGCCPERSGGSVWRVGTRAAGLGRPV